MQEWKEERGWLLIACEVGGGGLAILKKLRRFSNRPPTSSYLFRNGPLYILPVVKVNLLPPTDCCRTTNVLATC